jgi:DNA-binding transcriptional ArsR family regulator
MASAETSTSDGGVWLTIAELARRKGISRQAATKRINGLEEAGQITTRRAGRSREVELATFDRAVGQVGDGFKELAAESVRNARTRQEEPATSGLKDAQTERAKYEARLKALELAERSGLVVPLKGEHGIEGALIKICDQVLRDLGQPMQWIDDLLEAARQGEPQFRRAMRAKIADQRKLVAEHLMAISGEAAQAEADGIQIDIHFEGDD